MRNRLAVALFLSLALLWAPMAQAAPRGTVTIAINGEPETMDPHVYSSFIGAMVWPWASDLLIIQDAKEGKVVPWLAEKYERRARNLKSQPGKATAKRTATRHREQAANAAKSAGR